MTSGCTVLSRWGNTIKSIDSLIGGNYAFWAVIKFCH